MESRLVRLFVTGGAGHTGCNFLPPFLSDSDNNEAIVLVRAKTNRSYLPISFGDRLKLVEGDICDASIDRLMAGCDAALHIAQQTLSPQVAAAARRAGVRRVFFVTTTGVFSRFNDLSAEYRQIEEDLKASPLDWTILRPTMIYGSERDVNVHKLLLYLDTHSVFPVFGDGRGLMQPVYAGDLAEGLLGAVRESSKTSRKEYNLPGRSPLTYNELLRTALEKLDRQCMLIHLPHSVSLVLAKATEAILGVRSPVKSEQVRRLSEDKAFSWSAARDDFGYDPRSFTEGIVLEIGRLRELNLIR